MDKPTAQRYRGDFVAWTGVCGFIGEGGDGTPIAPHSHYAIQLAIGAPGGLRVQFGRHGEWQSCAAALFPSRATHSIDVNACAMSAVLFIEPETPQGKALAARLQGRLELLEPAAVSPAARRLEEAWRVDGSYDAVKAVCLQLIQDLSGTAPREPSDARVLAAIEYIRQRVDQAVSLPEVASAAHLSPERFRHLFVEETGMPLRTYLLWRRLLHVWTLLMGGETLSAAAHAAGFADSAHLSRTARTMFGLPPSILQMAGPLSTKAREQARPGRPGR
ncbi:AraC family transcriptional regulator [Ramlibacter monticola]|uniref:Helix-turn-helix transcriptional regulator n=1 Tax=Ramlibacter monticola TaxID=1926872 RepID=A0A936Z0D3_9BURK|nr:AraC family transcriptional regulator [Ramlibacter monticola]MBL0391466.1 helix-turn-helix transcriptional regulator [Ramlibacter monticola]